jgi:beta-xylosidase
MVMGSGPPVLNIIMGNFTCFLTLNEGGFMYTATKAEGPWQVTHLPKGFYDPGLFFDDDGRIYVAQGYNKISITR